MTLHNSLESFQKRQQRAKGRQGQRSRASSTSEARAGSTTPEQRQRTSSTTGNRASGKTTPTTPTRRAPPPPIGAVGRTKSLSDSLPRKKPARPAPAAPFKRRETVPALSPTSPSHDDTVPSRNDTSPQGTMPPWQEQPLPPSLFGVENSFGPGPHEVLDLDTSQTEPDDLPVSPPEHFRSGSDSLVQMHQKTHSLPDLTKEESSTSPEAEELEPAGFTADFTADLDVKSNSPHTRKRSTSMTGEGPAVGHTRHLSLIGVMDGSKQTRKKRPSKRQGSIKRRSRSPPNLPPPPPPPNEVIPTGSPPAIIATSPVGEPKRDTASPPEPLSPRERLSPLRHGSTGSDSLTAQASSTSLGFSEVMVTISNIDHQLDQLNSDVGESPPRPSIPVPVRSSASESNDCSTFKPIVERPEEEEEQIDFSVLDSGDPNQLYDSPDDTLDERDLPIQMNVPAVSPPPAVSSPPKIEYDGGPMSPVRTTPEGASSNQPPPRPPPPSDEVPPEIIENLPPADFTEKEVTNSVFYPEKTSPTELTKPQDTNWVARQPKLESKDRKPAAKQHRVMFKEEVEDIPPIYDPEPSYDTEPAYEPEPSYEPRVDEEIPSTVAELKKMLFGERESNTAKYKKEGSLSPRHNEGFDYPYEYQRDSSLSPNTSNSNQEGGRGVDPWPDLEEEENVYDMPWEKKTVSKYRVVGQRKKPGNGAQKDVKETLQFAEVSTHEAPTPGSTEVRNVHSLERPLKKNRPNKQSHSLDRPIKVPTLVEDSLLESISSTLQGRSKFGSDSLLTTIAMEATAASNAMQTYSPPQKRMTNGVRSSKRELEKIRAEHRRDPRYSPHTSPKTVAPAKPAKRVGFTQPNGQPRTAVSLDGLQRDPSTRVTYDSSTRSHVFRSLV